MNEITPSDKNENTPNGFVKALKALWRFFLLLVTGIILGGVIYFGFIQLYVNAVQVGQTSTSRLNVVETQSAQQHSQIVARLDQFSSRIGELEKQQSKQSELIADLQSRVQTLGQVLEKQILLLARLDTLENRIYTLESDMAVNTKNDQDLKDAMLSEDSPVGIMKRDVKVLKAMELINRARLYLMQNNVGLARTDIEMVYQDLLALKVETPDYQKPVVDGWLQRVDLVLKNLPGYPVLAADDLEIAWNMLAAGWTGMQVLVVSPTPLISTSTTPTLDRNMVITPASTVNPKVSGATPLPSVTP